MYWLYITVLACLLTPADYGWAKQSNTLSEQERAQGFKLLFDGTSMDQWRNYRAETIKPQWQIIDGTMVLTEKGGRDIITKEQYGFFDLRLEWSIARGGNSGIMFRVDEQTTKRLPWMVSPEYQLKDPYGKPRKSAGALYGLAETPDVAKASGQWNTTRILLAPGPDGTELLKYWLNDTLTVDLTIDHAPDSAWSMRVLKRNQEEDVAGTKFELPEEFFKAKTGPILLQDHGARVAFRNIRIRWIDPSSMPPRTGQAKKTGPPNIILIMADDISAKDFPTYGIPNPTYKQAPCSTPVLERMKHHGVQFRHAWATPLCHPSRGMIMTGRYANRTQWWSNGYGPVDGEKNHALYEDHLTLGQITKGAGYATQFVGKWQLGGTPDGYAFDEYVFTPGQHAARAPAEEKANEAGRGKPSFYWNPGYSLRNHPEYDESMGEKGQTFKTTWKDYAADIELKYIKNFMARKKKKGEPFFVYWPAHMGHGNWDYEHGAMGYPGVPPLDEDLYPGTENIKTTAPDGTIVEKTRPGINYHVQYLDHCMGELLEQTKHLGIDRNTVFIFTTDNATTSYGKGLKGAVKEHGPLVPLIVYGPGSIKAMGEVDDLVSLADVMPTVAEMTGFKLPSKYEFDGKSMIPFVTGLTIQHRDWVYSYNAEFQMVRTRAICRGGMGFYWDTRGTRDQEAYKMINLDGPDPALKRDVDLIKTVLNKYPTAPLSGPMYDRYMKEKAGKRELWDKMRARIMKEHQM